MRRALMFQLVVTACVLAMKRSRNVGVNHKWRKAAVIIMQSDEEQQDLKDNLVNGKGKQKIGEEQNADVTGKENEVSPITRNAPMGGGPPNARKLLMGGMPNAKNRPVGRARALQGEKR